MYQALQNQQCKKMRAVAIATRYFCVDVQKLLVSLTRTTPWLRLLKNFIGTKAILKMKGRTGVIHVPYLPFQIQSPEAVTCKVQRIVVS